MIVCVTGVVGNIHILCSKIISLQNDPVLSLIFIHPWKRDTVSKTIVYSSHILEARLFDKIFQHRNVIVYLSDVFTELIKKTRNIWGLVYSEYV